MAEVDTGSYPKAAAPVNTLDQMQKYGGLEQQKQSIESNKLTIDKQKLDLVNQRFGEMAKGFTGLIAKPDLTEDDVRQYVQNQVKLGYVPPEMAAQTISTLPPTQGMLPAQAAKVLKNSLATHLQHAQTTMEAINTHFGVPTEQTDNAKIYSGVRQSAMKGGGFTPSSETSLELPPTAPMVNDNPASPRYGQPGYKGPVGSPGPRPYVSAPPPPEGMVNNPSQGNLTGGSPMASGPTAPTVARGTEFNNRFSAADRNPPSGLAPGSSEAIQAVSGQSGKDYASALTRAKGFQAELYPAQAALEGVKELGPQGVGPGTDALNNIKSAIITWLPNADPKLIDNVGNFEQTRKYLTQIARSSGATGTNDQLAAAFEANPSIKMSQAATENVLKSVIALRKMEQAQTLLFNKTNLPPDQYSKWIATNQNVLDPRAFGFDLMSKEAKSKLLDQLQKSPPLKDKAGNIVKDENGRTVIPAYKRFEDSLQFAHDAGLIEPPKVNR